MADPSPQQRAGLNVSVGTSTGELQGILVQLGRIADLLQQLVNEYKANPPMKPQPFGQ